MASTRVTIFTGAPTSKDLDWSEASLLDNHTVAFERFIKFPSGYQELSSTPNVASQRLSAWRVVECHDEVNESNKSEEETSSPDLQDSEECHHSLFIYENTQLHDLTTLPTEPDITTNDITIGDSSFLDDSYLSQPDPTPKTTSPSTQLTTIPLPQEATRLQALPTAKTIFNLYPQTITVNLIAAVITKSQPRSILTKKDNREMILIELTVIDESAKPFDITFWLAPNTTNLRFDNNETGLRKIPRHIRKPQNDLQRQLTAIRNRDIVLLQNVALSEFRGKVKGQTLHPSAKVATSIVILGRDAVVQIGELRGSKGAVDRVQRVVEYARGYLPGRGGYVRGQGGDGGGGRAYGGEGEEQGSMLLPPDTPG